VNANQADLPVRTMCRVLRVSHSGYYDWLERPPSARSLDDAALVERIRAIHADSDATYGRPRVRKELCAQGRVVNAKRIAPLMRANAIRGVSRRRGFVVTTRRDKTQDKAPDLVQRRFEADGPDKLWVADMTYVPTWAGFIDLAVVLDACSRRVVGWSIGQDMTAELVLKALNMALQQRKPRGVIHHSDQGSQYTSLAFGKRCRDMGVKPSMGSVGDAYDNAMAQKLLRHARVRADRPAQLAEQSRGAPGAVHVDRDLVQPAPAPSRANLRLADRLRSATPPARTSVCQTRVTHRRRLRGMRHAAGG
jgi:putative transposase